MPEVDIQKAEEARGSEAKKRKGKTADAVSKGHVAVTGSIGVVSDIVKAAAAKQVADAGATIRTFLTGGQSLFLLGCKNTDRETLLDFRGLLHAAWEK